MKNTFLFLFLLISTIALTAQNNCSKYYPLTEGSSFEYTTYNKKGKVDGTTSYKITSVSNEGNTTNATMALTFTDKKGKEAYNSEYQISCADGTINIDYKSLFPSAMMKQYEDMGMEMELSGTDIEIPRDLSVGQALEDANVTVNMSMSGMNMKVTVDMTDRKVEKKETVTTAAGTFECYLLTETNTSEVMGGSQEMHSKLWLAEGVGMVKQETYKKNGNLMSRSELSKYSE